MSKPYEIHPAANLFPMMEESELRDLSDDIKANGLRQSVTVYDGKILDGRNRLKACELAGVEPHYQTLFQCESPTAWVLSVNLKRRHLTASQKAAVAMQALPMFEAEASERKKKLSGTRSNPGERKEVMEKIPQPARDKAAATVGVNPRYVSDAKKIKEKSPETFEKVLSGEVTIPEAKKQIWDVGAIATRPPEHEPEDDDSDGLWNLKQCWRKANKKEKAEFIKWIEESGSKTKTK